MKIASHREKYNLYQYPISFSCINFIRLWLIDVMRMVNAAIYGFIAREQSELMTLNRSPDASYEVMVDALLVAIEYIRHNDKLKNR